MLIKNETPMAPRNSGIHRLEGKDRWRWWQMHGFFSSPFKRKREEDKFKNIAIQHQLLFLTQLPVGVGIMLYTVGMDGLRMAAVGAFAWVIAFIFLILTFKQHCKYIVEVYEQPSGLLLKSPMLSRTIRWGEISDFFELKDGDYLLQSRDGADFILTTELTDSEGLFKRIQAVVPKNRDPYNVNFRLPNSHMDLPRMVCFAISLAVTFPFITTLAYPERHTEPISIVSIIGSIVAISLVVAYWKFTWTKVAELVRLSDHSCQIRTRSGNVNQIPLDEITDVKRLGEFHLLKSRRQGWLIILADKTETVSVKLLETNMLTLPVN